MKHFTPLQQTIIEMVLVIILAFIFARIIEFLFTIL
jgi:hypothetical protein